MESQPKGWCGFIIDPIVGKLCDVSGNQWDSLVRRDDWAANVSYAGGVRLQRDVRDVLWHTSIFALCRGWGVAVEDNHGWRCRNAAIEQLYAPRFLYERLPLWLRDGPVGILPPTCRCVDIRSLLDAPGLVFGTRHCEIVHYAHDLSGHCIVDMFWWGFDKRIHQAPVRNQSIHWPISCGLSLWARAFFQKTWWLMCVLSTLLDERPRCPECLMTLGSESGSIVGEPVMVTGRTAS